jgi:hypothetical protein
MRFVNAGKLVRERNKSIYDLVGATISKVEKAEDYFQLIMDTGIMNIFNPVKCYSLNEISYVVFVNQKV